MITESIKSPVKFWNLYLSNKYSSESLWRDGNTAYGNILLDYWENASHLGKKYSN